MKNFYAVIMAGGSGGRFWPMGRKKMPKQLLPLVNSSSMLRNTVDRLEGFVKKERLLVMTNSDIAEDIIKELPDIPRENIIIEPVGRDTAPCIALAAALLYRRDPDSVGSHPQHLSEYQERQPRTQTARRSCSFRQGCIIKFRFCLRAKKIKGGYFP